jgi:hypothetical protein
LVSVFDTKNKLTTVGIGKTAIKKRHIGRADMGIAGRRWRNAGSDGHVMISFRGRILR